MKHNAKKIFTFKVEITQHTYSNKLYSNKYSQAYRERIQDINSALVNLKSES
jgi:hypothetical protein